MAKSLLVRTIDKHETLNFTELETALLQIAAIINHRPLSARVFTEDEYLAICPSDLLLGRIAGYTRGVAGFDDGEIEPTSLHENLRKIETFVNQWWTKWIQDAFTLFTPSRKWKAEHRNLKAGNIVLIKAEKKYGKADFRLAKVE